MLVSDLSWSCTLQEVVRVTARHTNPTQFSTNAPNLPKPKRRTNAKTPAGRWLSLTSHQFTRQTLSSRVVIGHIDRHRVSYCCAAGKIGYQWRNLIYYYWTVVIDLVVLQSVVVIMQRQRVPRCSPVYWSIPRVDAGWVLNFLKKQKGYIQIIERNRVSNALRELKYFEVINFGYEVEIKF